MGTPPVCQYLAGNRLAAFWLGLRPTLVPLDRNRSRTRHRHFQFVHVTRAATTRSGCDRIRGSERSPNASNVVRRTRLDDSAVCKYCGASPGAGGFSVRADPPISASYSCPNGLSEYAAGVASHRDFYVGGYHGWPYWERELHWALPQIADVIRRTTR